MNKINKLTPKSRIYRVIGTIEKYNKEKDKHSLVDPIDKGDVSNFFLISSNESSYKDYITPEELVANISEKIFTPFVDKPPVLEVLAGCTGLRLRSSVYSSKYIIGFPTLFAINTGGEFIDDESEKIIYLDFIKRSKDINTDIYVSCLNSYALFCSL